MRLEARETNSGYCELLHRIQSPVFTKAKTICLKIINVSCVFHGFMDSWLSPENKNLYLFSFFFEHAKRTNSFCEFISYFIIQIINYNLV